MSLLFSLWTVLVCVIFVGVTWWALGRGRRQEFDEAARIPLADDRAPPPHEPGVD